MHAQLSRYKVWCLWVLFLSAVCSGQSTLPISRIKSVTGHNLLADPQTSKSSAESLENAFLPVKQMILLTQWITATLLTYSAREHHQVSDPFSKKVSFSGSIYAISDDSFYVNGQEPEADKHTHCSSVPSIDLT